MSTKTHIIRKFALALLLLFTFLPFTDSANAAKYLTDPSQLDKKAAAEYLAIREYIDTVDNSERKITTIRLRLERFLKEHSNFLPIYIEKVRYLVIYGYAIDGDTATYNKKALTILKDLEHKDPAYQKTYVLETHVYTNLGRYPEAMAASNKAESMDGIDPWIQLNKEVLLEIQGNYQQALYETIKALKNSGTNQKATKYAIQKIIYLSKTTRIDVSQLSIVDIVFKAVHDSKRRMFIASFLVNGNAGDPGIMKIASEMVQRQQMLTPDSPVVRLNAARIALHYGFQYQDVQGYTHFKKASVVSALQLLKPIENVDGYQDVVFALEAKAVLGMHDLQQTMIVIDHGQRHHVTQKLIDDTWARLYLFTEDYKESVKMFAKLAKADPKYLDDDGYCSAYLNNGDFSKFEDHYHRLMKNYPKNSWVFANYATFLLYKRLDYKGAMHYGEIAMKLENTSFARNVTGVAYQIAAAHSLQSGKVEEAMKKFGYGAALGASKEDLEDACGAFCHPVRDEFNKRYRDNL